MPHRVALHVMLFAATLLLPECSLAQVQVGTTADLRPGVPIRFRADGGWVRASLVAITPDSLSLTRGEEDAERAYALSRISELSYSAGKKSMILRGAAAGALGGAAAAGGMLLISSVLMPSDDGWTPSTSGWAVVGMSAGVGAALGALFGWAKPQERWVAVQVPRVQPIVAPTGGGVAIGMRLQF